MATLEDERDHYLSEAQNMAKRVDILMEEVSQSSKFSYILRILYYVPLAEWYNNMHMHLQS